MRISRLQARRELARDGKHGNGVYPSVLETLVSNLANGVARTAMRRVKHGVHEVVHWTVLRLILGWAGAVTLTGGILLLFGAGVTGLQALQFPLWLALLSTGAFAVLVAVVAMRGILWPRDDREND